MMLVVPYFGHLAAIKSVTVYQCVDSVPSTAITDIMMLVVPYFQFMPLAVRSHNNNNIIQVIIKMESVMAEAKTTRHVQIIQPNLKLVTTARGYAPTQLLGQPPQWRALPVGSAPLPVECACSSMPVHWQLPDQCEYPSQHSRETPSPSRSRRLAASESIEPLPVGPRAAVPSSVLTVTFGDSLPSRRPETRH